jgi:hypothetical protein
MLSPKSASTERNGTTLHLPLRPQRADLYIKNETNAKVDFGYGEKCCLLSVNFKYLLYDIGIFLLIISMNVFGSCQSI